ncbi:unnamed protein product [Effrenium voratum]|uniref:Uncharacterized protein n=1 Tax=Effrenium voratum TaxID=2562239 RepID=A0AA36MLL7_9DINO|nr:unnamed protein product [Effrenium voratum]CAJ1450849.1 unnamed protein product [Effrenium voratum]
MVCVRFGKAGVLEREALGKTESYSQPLGALRLMFWSETLFKPVIAGGHGISTEAAAKDMSSTSWAYDKRTGWKYPSWREIGAQQAERGSHWLVQESGGAVRLPGDPHGGFVGPATRGDLHLSGGQ